MVAIVTGNGLGLQSSSALGLGERGRIGNASFGQTGEQIYVNAATGNLVIQDRDELLLGQGVGSAMYRAYNSQGQLAGDHWRAGGARAVNGLTGALNTAGSSITRTDWDGSATAYLYDATRKVYVSTVGAGASASTGSGYSQVSTTGARATLAFDALSNSWIWNDGAQLSEVYDVGHAGRLIAARDRDGNTVSYTYNTGGLLSSVHTASGDDTYLDYNGVNQLTALRTVYRNNGGQLVSVTTVRYAYDAQGRLSQVITDLTPDDNSVADGNFFTTTYTYDGTSSRIASISQSDGSRLEFSYRLVGTDYRVSTISQTGDNGAVRVTTFAYDAGGNQTTVTDPLGYQQVLKYSASGQLQSIVASNPFESREFYYDDQGNIFVVSTGDGHNVYFRYDGNGNLIFRQEKSSNVFSTYGPNNELLTETIQPAWVGDTSTTRRVYDASGHVRFVISAEGRVTEFRYNAAGQQISEIQYSEPIYDVSELAQDVSPSLARMDAWKAGLLDASQATRVDTAYDFRGNIATITRYGKLMSDGTGDAQAGPGEVTQIRYVYDPFGRLLQRYVGEPGKEKVEQFTYDGLGRLLTAKQFDGVLTTYQYDDSRHTVSVVFSNGLTRTSTYNAAGELIAVADSVVGKPLSRTENYYDANGRVRMTVDANGQKTHYLYNGIGQQVAEIGPDGVLTEYVYNRPYNIPANTITYATHLTTDQLTTLVDANGRPIEKIGSAALTLDSAGIRPPAKPDDRKAWTFYLNNNLLDTTVNADGTITNYNYDGTGRLVSMVIRANRADVGGLPATRTVTSDPVNDRTTRYFYDRDGLLRGQLDPEGYLTEYRYNGAGKRIETIRYATASTVPLTDESTISQVIPPASPKDIHESYLYDARGLLRSEIDGEGYLTSYQYDAYGNVAQRIRGQQVDRAQLNAPQQVPIAFQAKATSAGGVGSTVEVWIDGVRAGTVTVGSTSYTTYKLTASNIVPIANHTIEFRSSVSAQLSIKDASFGARVFAREGDTARSGSIADSPTLTGVSYTLDATQTALSWANSGGVREQTQYVYDAMGRLLERSNFSSSGNVVSSYAYDSQSHVTAETTGDRTVSYQYDARGRLTGQLSGEGSAALAALGKSPSQAQTDAVWKSWGVHYAYDAAGHRTSMTDANGNRTLYYYDHVGRLTHVINPLGEVVESQYDAFAEVTQTVAYATRLSPASLAALEGGLLSDSLKKTFTALGNDGLSARTSFSYSAAGALTRSIDAAGFKTDYAYNAFGEQVSATRDISATVRVQNTTDYDRLGHIIRQTSDAGGLNLITRAVYDAFGRVTESIDAKGVLRRQDYDRNGHVVVLTDGTGAQSRMTYDAFDNVLTRTDATGNKTSYAYTAFNREITVTTAEGIKTTSSYNEAGQLLTLTDGRGNATQYAYDRDGNLLKTTNATGASVTRTYDHADQLIDVVDARGTHTAYAYDAAGRTLTRTVDPSGLKLVTRYEYDARGQTAKVTDPSGVVTETQYDLNGRQVSVTVDKGGLNLRTTFAYDGVGNILTVTEGAGSSNPRVTQNTWDKTGRLVSATIDPVGLKLTTRYTYDANGNVVSVTDSASGVTRYVYDAENRQTWSVDATGAVARNVYDGEGRVVSRQAFASQISVSSLPLSLADSDISARLVSWPDRDQSVSYVYDADGRVRYVVNALNYVTEKVYDAAGNVISTIAYNGAISVAGALTTGSVAAALSAQGSAVHSADRVTRMVYDAANRHVFTVDALGYLTQNRYDANGNLVEQTAYKTLYPGVGSTTQNELQNWLATPAPGGAKPLAGRVTTWIYDAANRPAYVIDPADYLTANRYDAAGHLTTVIRYADAYSTARSLTQTQAAALLPSTVPATAVSTNYRYDTAGRLASTANAIGVVTRYELDALGRAVNTFVADGLPEQTVTHVAFDAAGRMIEQTRAFGTPVAVTTRYEYDGAGRITRMIDPRGVELAERDTEWALAQRKVLGFVDSSGNALAATALTPAQRDALLTKYATTNKYDGEGHLTQTVDPLGYKISHIYDAFGNEVATVDQAGSKTTFFYDKLDRLVVEVSPNYWVVKTDYSPFGQPVQITHFRSFKPGPTGNEWYSDGWKSDLSQVLPPADPQDAITRLDYDKLDRLVKSTDAEGFFETYSYDGLGNRVGYVNKLGGKFSYVYDRRGLLYEETLPTPKGWTVTFTNRFEYDARGNLFRMTEAQGLQGNRVTWYVYDALDRQIAKYGEYMTVWLDGRWTGTTPVETTAYDARGNIVKQTDANGNATTWYYDAANHKTGQVSPTGTLTLWTYDSVGNQIGSRVFADAVKAVAGSQPPSPVNPSNVRETRYAYDANNHLTQTRILNVATGYYDPTSGEDQRGNYFITSGSELVTTREYDGRGWLIATTDPAGNRTVYFYNNCGQKTLEVDAKGYGTAWSINAKGDVSQEIHFALSYPDPITANQSLGGTLINAWPRSADDRVTNYTYDRNGRLISESRLNVQFAKVDANGKLAQYNGNATTQYSYDGDGNLLRKIDANGSQYDFTYDAIGRLTGSLSPAFVDYLNRQVRSETVYEYGVLGQIVRETQIGASAGSDRVIVYSYGAGGRLASTTNELGYSVKFRYDAAGNVMSVETSRGDADGQSHTMRTSIRYDAENREMSRIQEEINPSTGLVTQAGTAHEQRYNAFGEITGRRTGGGGANGAWQEYADYNNAGWVVRTNFDDGISQLFMYDRNGNATLKVESMETDLRDRVITTGEDLETLLQSIDMMQTYTRYDARNQVIQIRQPKTSGSAPRVSFSPVDIPIDGGKFANTQLSIGGWLEKKDRPVPGPVLPLEGGDVSIVQGNASVGVTVSWTPGTSVEKLSIAIPALQSTYGLYDVSAVVTYRAYGNQWSGGPNNQSTTVSFDTGQIKLAPVIATPDGVATLSVPIGFKAMSRNTYYNYSTGPVNFEYTVQVYLTPRNQVSEPQLIGTIAKSAKLFDVTSDEHTGDSIYNAPANALDSTLDLSIASKNSLTVAHGTLPPGAQAMLYFGPAGSTANFQLLGNGATSEPHSYTADIGSLPDGDYEMIFMAVSDGSDGRAPGTLLRRDGYAVHIGRAGGSSVTQTDLPYYAESARPGFAADSSGSYIWSSPQVLNVYSPQSIDQTQADRLVARVRGAGEANWRSEYPVTRNPATGAFPIDLSAYAAGSYDVEIDLYAGGTKIDALRGTVNLPGGDQQPVFAFGHLGDYKSTLVFHTQPADTEYLTVSWEQDGKTHYSEVRRLGNGDFTWDLLQDGLIPQAGNTYNYSIKYTAYDAYGRPLAMGAGDIRIGTVGDSQVTLTGSERPCIFEFSPTDAGNHPLTNATSLTLYYRQAPHNDEDYARPFAEVTLTRDPGGRFLFDATSLPTNIEYEYRYLAKDASGAVLMERESYFLTGTRNNPVTNVDIVGVIDQTSKDMTIDRMQSHDAFGDVSAERDGRGNWTYLSYNTMGLLTLKQEPQVKVTLANGAQITLAPLTSFYYDLVGNLVGQKDANGNLSTQQWNYGLAQPAAAKSWDAMGYSKVFQYDVTGNLRVSTDELNRRTEYTYDRENRLIQVAHPVLANGQRSIDSYEYDSRGNRIAHTDALGGRERTYYDVDGRIVKTISAAGRTVQYDYRWASTISSLGAATPGGWVRTMTDANGQSMVDETDMFGRLMKHTDLGGHVFQYTYNWAGLLTKQVGSTGQNVDYTYYSHGLVRSIVDNATKTQSLYEYDGDGNRTAEFFQSFGSVYKFAQSTVVYDALNRVVSISDDNYQVYYEYDAVGNRRRMQADYTDMVGYHAKTQEYWYEYDALNRFTVSMGSLSGARAVDPNGTSVSIVVGAAGGDGVQLGYNAAGERTLAVYALDGRTERYGYDANGYLTTQAVNGVVVQERINDRLGRVTAVVERDAKSGQVVTNATRSWDADSLMTSEHDNIGHRTTTYSRMADGTLSRVAAAPDQGSGTTMTTTYSYEWWDGAKQKAVVSQGTDPSAPGWRPATSYFNYDVNGNLVRAYDDGGSDPGAARAFTYWTDLRGQVQRRDELVGVSVDANGTITGAAGDRKHNYYYLNGNRVGNQGNDGTDKVDYVQELAGKLGKGSESQYKVFTPVGSADFDENFMAINGAYPGVSPGQWTVRAGDTLQSVASALWGDSTLWYILAEANGLKGEDVLKAGQVLTVPNRVTNVHNTATTFKPYDPGRAIGDTSPTLPAPPPPPSADGGCGGMASIIAIAVAVAITAVTGGAGAGIVPMMLGGALGSAAAQGVMIAAGEQRGFSLKQMGMSAIAAGVTAGMPVPAGVGGAVAQGAARSVMTQGLGVATGLQHSFDWKGVAAGAIASGAGYGVGQTQLGKVPVVGSIASGMAAGAASTLVRGGSLTRNMGAISMDAIGSTIGNMAASKIADASAASSSVISTSLRTQQLISDVTDRMLPVGLGGVGFGLTEVGQSVSSNYNPYNSLSANDAAVQMMGLAPDDARELMKPDNGPSIVGPPFSPEVKGYAVPYPNIQVSELPVFTLNDRMPLAQTEGGFLRGLSGDKRSVFEAPAPLSEMIGSGVRAVGDFFAAPPIEIGNQYRDLGAHALGLSSDWSSGFGQQLAQGNYGAAALTEFGAVAGTLPLAGASVRGVASLGPTAGAMMESGVARMGGQLSMADVGNVGRIGEVGTSTGTRQSGFIFRGDGRSPDVIFQEGFQSKGLSQDIYRYATENIDSIFVSTSKSPSIAREFASFQGKGHVYTIRGQSAGVDVNGILGSRSPFPHELEVAVPKGVRPTDIMGARSVGPDGKFIGPFIKNPGYIR